MRAQVKAHTIEPWRLDHDSRAFSCGMHSIDRYIKEQAHRDMSSHASLVFVMTEPGERIIHAYYALSAISVVFGDLPSNIQKRLPRYPQIPGTLLGRLGVDRNYRARLQQQLGEPPRLGELLLVDAQQRTLLGATTVAGAALMVVDTEEPTAEERAAGVRDALDFYAQYGFAPLPGNPRRLFKLTRVIESEFLQAQT
jgi:hypothetical protein